MAYEVVGSVERGGGGGKGREGREIAGVSDCSPETRSGEGETGSRRMI